MTTWLSTLATDVAQLSTHAQTRLLFAGIAAEIGRASCRERVF